MPHNHVAAAAPVAATVPTSSAPPAKPAARASGRPRRARVAELLLAVAVAVNALVALSARHFPYQDAPNHLARYVLIHRFWSGDAPPGVDVRFVPTPYFAIDLVGVALVHLFGPGATGKILAVAALTVLPCGMYFLFRRVAPTQRGWALVGALLGYSWFVLAGMLNFSIGFGLALVWLACWWPRRARASWPAMVGLALGAAVLFAIHMAAALVIVVVVGLDSLLTVGRRVRDPDQRSRALRLPELLAAGSAALGVGAMWAWDAVAGGSAGQQPLAFRTLASKIAAFGAPFYSISLTQAAVMAVGYVAALAAFVYANRRGLGRNTLFVLAAATFLGIFLVFPRDVGAAGATDVRWLMPLYVFVFFTAGSAARPPARAMLGVAFAACLANAGTMWGYTRVLDRKLDDFDAALRYVPPGARLLPLISDLGSYPRVGPYQQYALWHIIRRRGEVPSLFALSGVRPDEPAFPHFQHFVVRDRPLFPKIRWGTTDHSELDWHRIALEYDYIVQVSDSARTREYVSAHATEVARSGDVRVFAVRRPNNGPPATHTGH